MLAAVSAASLISFSHRSRGLCRLMLEEVRQTVTVFKVAFVPSGRRRDLLSDARRNISDSRRDTRSPGEKSGNESRAEVETSPRTSLSSRPGTTTTGSVAFSPFLYALSSDPQLERNVCFNEATWRTASLTSGGGREEKAVQVRRPPPVWSCRAAVQLCNICCPRSQDQRRPL